MEQSSQDKTILEAQIRELYGRTAYTHKTHEKAADIYTKQNNCLKISQIGLSAITTTSLLYALFGNSELGTIIGAIFSAILFALNTYLKNMNFGELSQKHVFTANLLWGIREKYLSLLTDLNSSRVDIEQLREKRNAYQAELQGIYENAPRTFNKAYKLAQDALKLNEELTFSDEEINKFLPTPLRKNSN